MKSRLFLVDQSALEVGGHYFAYTRTVAAGAKAVGLDVTILQNRRFSGDWNVEGAEVISAFHHTWTEASQMWLREWRPGQIAYDLHKALLEKPPRTGDHIFFSTLGNAELQAILEYLAGIPAGRDHPTYHILLRYDPHEIQDHWEHYQPLFRRVAESALLRRVLKFYTDTHLLTQAYSRLTGLPFTTVPIPFSQERLKARLAIGRHATAPLVVTYLGDARLEKNFADIPDAVSYLWKDYISTGRVRFVLQANFNIEGGEPGMLKAVQRLGQAPSSVVELIEQPLSSDQYYDVLADADIVLVPYDAQRYRYRSSGILIEAMAAGKPVVTTRTSWMATQVSAEHSVVFSQGFQLGAAIEIAIGDFKRLKNGAEAIASAIQDASDSANFIRVLLNSEKNDILLKSSGPHILYIADSDAILWRTGAAKAFMGRLDYLVAVGYRVSMLILMRSRCISIGQIETFTQDIKERLAQFDLEGVFLASRGRLSSNISSQRQRRECEQQSVSKEIDDISHFDINLELLRHLHINTPDLIWLNCITNISIVNQFGFANMPLICEVHAIRAFQKAIYEGRRVRSDDVATEIALLSRCGHLICISQKDADYIRQYTSNVHVTTVDFCSNVKALGIRNLAGAINLAEVLSTCGPVLPDYKLESSSGAGLAMSALRLAKRTSIDLLYVSPDPWVDVSGLRWFLNDIYMPYFAPFGITFVIVGSINEHTEWPEHDNLFVVGHLDRLEPLYAAARVVVVPIIEGEGAAAEMVEALTYGRPIVATSIALGGLDAAKVGVSIADTPETMSHVIRQLLNSEALRRERASEARQAARQLADSKSRASLLDDILLGLLGDRVLTSPVTPDIAADDDLTEWTPTVEHVNRLVRNLLENEPLDQTSLKILCRQPRDSVEAALRGVVAALIVDQDALSLLTEKQIMRAVAGREIHYAEIVVSVILTALDFLIPRNESYRTQNNYVVVFDARYDLAISTLDQGANASWEQFGYSLVFLEPKGSISSLNIPVCKSRAPRSILTAAKVHSDDGLQTVLISQRITLNSDTTGGRSATGFGVALGLHKPTKLSADITIKLPPLYSASFQCRIIDILIDADPSLAVDIECDGMIVFPERLQKNKIQVLRLRCGNKYLSAPELSFNVRSGMGVILEVVSRIALGDNHEQILSALDMLAAINTANIGGARDNTSDKSLYIIEELKKLAEQHSISRRRALNIREFLGLDLDASLAQLIEGIAGGESGGLVPALLADSLDARRLLSKPAVLPEGRVIASRGLTMTMEATFMSETEAGRAKCIVDDIEAPCIQIEGAQGIWRVEGRAPKTDETWLRRIHFVGDDGDIFQPTAVWVVFHFVAAQDRTTGTTYVQLSNSYEPEVYNADVGRVWIGPERVSRLTLPLAITGSGELRLSLASIGDNIDPDDLALWLNGVELKAVVEYKGEGALITAEFLADVHSLLITELNVNVKKTFSPPGDNRKLGVAINSIDFRLPL